MIGVACRGKRRVRMRRVTGGVWRLMGRGVVGRKTRVVCWGLDGRGIKDAWLTVVGVWEGSGVGGRGRLGSGAVVGNVAVGMGSSAPV